MKGGKSADLDKKSAKNLIIQSFILAGVQFLEPAFNNPSAVANCQIVDY